MYRSDLIWFNVCICIIQDRKCQIINDMIHSKIPIYTQSESWDGSQIPSAKKKKSPMYDLFYKYLLLIRSLKIFLKQIKYIRMNKILI
jgi:hypothetical protein